MKRAREEEEEADKDTNASVVDILGADVLRKLLLQVDTTTFAHVALSCRKVNEWCKGIVVATVGDDVRQLALQVAEGLHSVDASLLPEELNQCVFASMQYVYAKLAATSSDYRNGGEAHEHEPAIALFVKREKVSVDDGGAAAAATDSDRLLALTRTMKRRMREYSADGGNSAAGARFSCQYMKDAEQCDDNLRQRMENEAYDAILGMDRLTSMLIPPCKACGCARCGKQVPINVWADNVPANCRWCDSCRAVYIKRCKLANLFYQQLARSLCTKRILVAFKRVSYDRHFYKGAADGWLAFRRQLEDTAAKLQRNEARMEICVHASRDGTVFKASVRRFQLAGNSSGGVQHRQPGSVDDTSEEDDGSDSDESDYDG
jgi:hypothetical protein